MKTSYVLIDFENVQVKSLALLKGDNFQVKVFIGPRNSRLPVELVLAMHELGHRADYIQLGVSGANALDFHITYYLGRLTAKHPEDQFHIISKDTGFDSLIKHLHGKGIHCKRSASIELMLGVAAAHKAAIEVKNVEPKKVEPKAIEPKRIEPKKSPPKAAAPKTTASPKSKAAPAATAVKARPPVPITATLQNIIENLKSRGTALPKTIKTLSSSIKTLRLNLSDEQIAEQITQLQSLGKIKVNVGKVAYKL